MSNQNKKVLITGVSRGLGKVLAEYLQKEGWFVYGTARDLAKVKDTEFLKHIELDLQKKKSIQDASDHLFSLTDTLDAVIHNSGVAYLTPAEEMKETEIHHTFDVNFFGPMLLTELLLPRFRKAKKGKIIYVSSIASVDPWPSLSVYSASKAAFERVAFEWAVLLKKWNITTSIIRPNPLPTDMQILKSEGDATIFQNAFLNELEWEKVEDVCNLINEILNSKSPKFEYTTGPLSKETVDSLLVKNGYQKLIEKYIEKRETLGT